MKLTDSLNHCEKEIINKLWSRYEDILFPPKPLPYQVPSKGDAQMNKLVFNLNKNTPVNDKNIAGDCVSYYPYIEDTEDEACELNKEKI